MKFKISKSQWEAIGKTAGWDDIPGMDDEGNPISTLPQEPSKHEVTWDTSIYKYPEEDQIQADIAYRAIMSDSHFAPILKSITPRKYTPGSQDNVFIVYLGNAYNEFVDKINKAGWKREELTMGRQVLVNPQSRVRVIMAEGDAAIIAIK